MATFRIVICGKSQCQLFAEVCLMADYLKKELPTFCYERMEKSSLEWQPWLRNMNQKYCWNHSSSPIVWKELLFEGSKPYYIGGASDFFEYCHAYYNFDFYMDPDVFAELNKSVNQYRQKVKLELDYPVKIKPKKIPFTSDSPKSEFRVAIFGCSHPLAIPLISGLVEIYLNSKRVSRIYIFDDETSQILKQKLIKECEYIGHKLPNKIVKYVENIEKPLKKADMLIILKHIPYSYGTVLGEWLFSNARLMYFLGHLLNVHTTQKMYIVFANLGPACFNATMLRKSIVDNKDNIVVATSGLALDVLQTVSEATNTPIGTIFCPPVWGFVGINHLVDIRTTLYKYNAFEPYRRYRRVRDSTLTIGSVTPEIRTMEHLVHFEEDIWNKVVEKRAQTFHDQDHLYKVEAIISLIKRWLFDPDPAVVMSVGVPCDGSFGLKFAGVFSQPCQLKKDRWRPAKQYMLPKDQQVKLYYLEDIAKKVMTMKKDDLPDITPYKLTYRFPVNKKRATFITWNFDSQTELDFKETF